MSRSICLYLSLFICLLLCGCTAATSVSVVDRPDTSCRNDFYVSNRPPLLPNPLIKLPVGTIEPKGWLRRQLELQADGFHGHLTEISGFLKKQNNAWLSPQGQGHSPWEEVPYWLRGFGDTGYVLDDQRIIREARQWIEAVIASQRDDGYFGPRSNLTRIKGKPDLWPNMIMLNALQSYYEYSGDQRVLELMTKYFRWQLTIPDQDFLLPFWQNQRASDNLASVYWLYNRTGEKWLLKLAEKIHRNTANWTAGIASWHGVNITQCFRGPAIFYQQSHDPSHLAATERNYDTVMGIYGQVPGGMFGADENCRQGYTGPRQAAETCSMVEFMLSHEMLLAITGDSKWADRCEQIAFNSLPAAMTADLKALHYLTAPNMTLCDSRSKAPGLQNAGPMLLFNPYYHRCCQHNVGHGWPYFTQRLWMATPDNGLAAIFYAPCRLSAKVGNGTRVTIEQNSRYPFEQTVRIHIRLPKPTRFPIYLRIPRWCTNPAVTLNGQRLSFEPRAGAYIRIYRRWHDNETLTLELPMRITIKTWTKNNNSVSIDRGPLTYSLKIGEKYVRQGGTDKWPAWEIHPTTPWNYGLLLNKTDPTASFEVVHRPWPNDDQPFRADAAPIELRVKAKRIPAWKLDALGLVGKLQPSPARSDQPTETITLIPMGCARLRISAFPTIGSGPDAHQWQQPSTPLPASASHCWPHDTITALSDNLLPKSSNDQSIPRFTWWDHKGTTEWVQYDFDEPRTISGTAVYWFDDTGTGGCRVPAAWRLLYKAGDQWKQVPDVTDYPIQKDTFNTVTFQPIQTTALRLEVRLQPDYSGGILEWQLNPKTSVSQ